MEKNFSLKKLKILSGSTLKLIAIITMFIDHSALILFSDFAPMLTPIISIGGTEITGYYILRKIGRLAFPIFCFLITEGFLHTRNRKKYGINMLIFAIISEIPYDLMIGKNLFYLNKQNIFVTLFLGFLALCILEKVPSEPKKFVILFLIVMTAAVLNTDYGFRGVTLIIVMYIMRNSPALQTIFAYPMLSGGIAALGAFVPINMYNGERGFIKTPFLKYAFYIFYPLHIMVLLIIKRFVF